jgi:hypothetical protein
VTLELAEDRRDGVRAEGDLAGGIEAVDRLDQAERRDLDEVVEGLVGALVTTGELTRERQEALGELVAGSRVPGLEAQEQRPVLGVALRTTGRGC